MAHRMGYLPTVAQQVQRHFQHVLLPGEDTPWFEYNGLPLRWQLPVGVLYDMLTRHNERPWTLTIHYRSFPADALLRWDGGDTLRASFFNSLKEAACICRGSASRVMGMAMALQQELWASVEAADGARYSELSESLGLAPAPRQERRPTVPLRLNLVPAAGRLVGYEDVESTSQPVEAHREDGSLVSLADALRCVWPALQLPTSPPAESPATPVAPPGGSATVEASRDQDLGMTPPAAASADAGVPGLAVAAAAMSDTAVAAEGNGSGPTAGPRAVRVLIAGVAVPLELPVAWLHSRMHAADHFLYATVYVL